MDFSKYINDATRTESVISSVNFNQENLVEVLNVFIASGNLLDMIKKNVFYGKEIDKSKWNIALSQIRQEHIKNIDTANESQSINIDPRLFHTILGIATEGTELIEAALSTITSNNDLDLVNIREEFFDVCWYLLVGHDAINQPLDQTLEMGFNKLKLRYPDKFTSEAAINRDTDAERELMETYQ
jgi:hypothetical protein